MTDTTLPLTKALWRAGLLLLPMLLAGCGASSDERLITYAGWRQMDPLPQPRVAQTPVSHVVAFSPAEKAVGDIETEALAMFLDRSGVKPGDRVTISTAVPAGGSAALAGSRLASVRAALGRLGVAAATLPPGTGPVADDRNGVVVTARVLAVLPPDCPGYNAPVQLDFEHRPVVNPGCANAANLGLMVADPADLVAGRPLAPADGEAAANAIQRYRADKVWPSAEPAEAVPFRTGTQ